MEVEKAAEIGPRIREGERSALHTRGKSEVASGRKVGMVGMLLISLSSVAFHSFFAAFLLMLGVVWDLAIRLFRLGGFAPRRDQRLEVLPALKVSLLARWQRQGKLLCCGVDLCFKNSCNCSLNHHLPSRQFTIPQSNLKI